jgi:hypothetical protein
VPSWSRPSVCQTKTRLERLLPVSGMLLILGLMVEAATLLWIGPSASLMFCIVGGLLVFAGTLTFLYSLFKAEYGCEQKHARLPPIIFPVRFETLQ